MKPARLHPHPGPGRSVRRNLAVLPAAALAVVGWLAAASAQPAATVPAAAATVAAGTSVGAGGTVGGAATSSLPSAASPPQTSAPGEDSWAGLQRRAQMVAVLPPGWPIQPGFADLPGWVETSPLSGAGARCRLLAWSGSPGLMLVVPLATRGAGNPGVLWTWPWWGPRLGWEGC